MNSAVHVGGKGGLRVGGATILPEPLPDMDGTDVRWLRDHGIDWDGESPIGSAPLPGTQPHQQSRRSMATWPARSAQGSRRVTAPSSR